MQYGTSSGVYAPNEKVKVDIAPPLSTECDNVISSNMSCSFNAAMNTSYTVMLKVSNRFGQSSSSENFNCKFNLLS